MPLLNKKQSLVLFYFTGLSAHSKLSEQMGTIRNSAHQNLEFLKDK